MAKLLTILGDSIMKGVMYNSERDRYVLYNDGWFIESALDSGLEIKKHCRMGATVEYGLDSLSSIREGTSVLVEFGGNDSNFNWSLIADAPKAEHDPVTPPNAFYNMYKKLIEGIKRVGAEPIALNLIPIDAETFFKWISKKADGGRVLEWLGDENMLYRWHEYYNRIIETTAAACGARLIDIRSSILQSRRYPDLIGGDGLHPSRKGHALIRSGLLDALSAQ